MPRKPLLPSPLVEVTDNQDLPLAHLPLRNVLRQGLRFRLVQIALCTPAKTLFLRKRPSGLFPQAGRWDLFTTPVYPGEARQDAALRCLAAETCLPELPLRFACLYDSRPNAAQQITLFSLALPLALQSLAHEGNALLEVDAEELQGLAQDVPELLTQELLWLASPKAGAPLENLLRE